MMKNSYKLIFFLLLTCCFQSLFSQDDKAKAADPQKWHYRVEPYLIIPNMKGSTGVEALPLVDVDASPSDIFSNFQMGFMLYFEASNDKWSINSDMLYMNLGQDITPTNLINSGSVDVKQFGWEIAGLRRLKPWLEVGIGGLLNSLEVEMNITRNQAGGGTVSQNGKKSKTWLDPMLIARLSTPANKKWTGQFRGEVGGFGIGSDFAWQVQGLATYRFSKLFDMSAGYRALGIDYSSGDGGKTFIYDIVMFGPVIRFGFNF